MPNPSSLFLPQHVRQLSLVMSLSCWALIIVLPIAEAIYWAVGDVGALAVRANLHAQAVHGPLSTWQRLAGANLMEIPLLFLLVGVWQAQRCFELFHAGEMFTPDAIHYLRRFAAWSVAAAVGFVIAKALVSLVITANNPPGQRMLAIGFGSDQWFLLFFAGTVWVMASVISQGQRLADENAAFI